MLVLKSSSLPSIYVQTTDIRRNTGIFCQTLGRGSPKYQNHGSMEYPTSIMDTDSDLLCIRILRHCNLSTRRMVINLLQQCCTLRAMSSWNRIHFIKQDFIQFPIFDIDLVGCCQIHVSSVTDLLTTVLAFFELCVG